MSEPGPLDAATAAIWARHRPEVLERVALVRAGLLDGDDARRRAGEAAHKLSGSLGMFGLHAGSELGGRLELYLAGHADGDPATLLAELDVLEGEILGW